MNYFLKRPLLLLLILTLIKGIVTSIFVPLWEFPDEQAHFAYVNYLAEGKDPTTKNDLSREIYQAERIMGTLRSDSGQNKYTYNSGYKIEFSSTIIGPNEQYLKNLPERYRSDYVKREAAIFYPSLFYRVSLVGHNFVSGSDIIARVFATRMISVLITVASVYVSYWLGKLLFEDNKLFAFSFATLLSFHPMFSFVSSGINNDNLTNFFGLVSLYFALKIYRDGLTLSRGLIVGIVSGLGILTKPLMLPLLLPVGLTILLEWYKTRRSFIQQIKLLGPLVLAGTIAGGWLILKPLVLTGKLPYITNQKANSGQQGLSLISFLIPQIKQYYRETLVWYWGVFKWLGVILPLNLIRFIKVGMIVSGLGLGFNFVRKKKVMAISFVGLLILFTFSYAAAITLWDYDAVRKNGFSHGIQGRYFFPTIGAHLGLMFAGLLSLGSQKWQSLIAKIVASLMIMFHTISLHTLAQAYYDTSSLNIFLIQASQYKPLWLKYPYNLFWLSLYTLVVLLFLIAMWTWHEPKLLKKGKQK